MVFKDEPEYWQRLDYSILQNGAISLYHQTRILAEDVKWLSEHDYQIFTFDCTRWETMEVFHDDVSRILNFPGYYGQNLNAFNDCMGDLEIPENGGVALQFLRYDFFVAKM